MEAGMMDYPAAPAGPDDVRELTRCTSAEAGSIDGPPVNPDQVIDRSHLARMTLGEAALEREVLALFDQQAAMLLARMTAAPANAVAALAHTLNGSARGIGAWRVSQAAAVLECAAASHDPIAPEAIEPLADAVAEARAAIAEFAQSH
jgi:HPt (histidine-containing phosphotransfer) domain-containing protein